MVARGGDLRARAHLGAEAAEWYGVTPQGNFEGRTSCAASARDLLRPPEIETARIELLAARAGSVPPGLDDKIITEWNAMMCSTLAEAAGATGRDDWSGQQPRSRPSCSSTYVVTTGGCCAPGAKGAPVSSATRRTTHG